MTDRLRYWIYIGVSGTATVHRSDCGHCNDGKGRESRAAHIETHWYGFYATRGAAIDAVDILGYQLNEDVCVSWD